MKLVAEQVRDGVREDSACLRVGRGLKLMHPSPPLHLDGDSACLRVGRGLKLNDLATEAREIKIRPAFGWAVD